MLLQQAIKHRQKLTWRRLRPKSRRHALSKRRSLWPAPYGPPILSPRDSYAAAGERGHAPLKRDRSGKTIRYRLGIEGRIGRSHRGPPAEARQVSIGSDARENNGRKNPGH